MFDCLWPYGLYSPWNSPGQNTGVGSFSILWGFFPTQGSNPGLPDRRWILYQLSHKRSPRILGWIAYPFSSRSSQPGNWTGVFCIAGGCFTNWAIREAPILIILGTSHKQNQAVLSFCAWFISLSITSSRGWLYIIHCHIISDECSACDIVNFL